MDALANLTIGGIILIAVAAGFGFAVGGWLWGVLKSWFIDDGEKKKRAG